MGIRRTREEKVQIQQRREQQKYSWNEEKPLSSQTIKERVSSSQTVSSSDKSATFWLKYDLMQTGIAVSVVLLLLAIFVWRY